MATAVLVPLQLNALALTASCCDETNGYRIAPVEQPNYTFLRFDDHLLASDILDHVDLHAASPAPLNSRLTDLGSGALRQNRLGVYLHWTLPTAYRTATSSDAASSAQTATPDFPTFRPIPNRWLVVRRLHTDPAQYPAQVPKLPVSLVQNNVQAWVIESDYLSHIDDLDDTVDLEVDRSPFINPASLNPEDDQIISGQAEVFIGRKTDLNSWDAVASADQVKTPHIDLNIMTSNNPLFGDYVPHNMNVLSMLDDFSYTSAQNTTARLSYAVADYHVIGWHQHREAGSSDPFANTILSPKGTNADRLQQFDFTLKDKSSAGAATWVAGQADSYLVSHASMYNVVYDQSRQPPNVAAETAAEQLHARQPVAVGVSALDALLAMCKANIPRDRGGTMGDVEQDLLILRSLLDQQEDDDVDGLQAAADESLEMAFTKVFGGNTWHFNQQSSTGTQPGIPSPDLVPKLAQLNLVQSSFDCATRELASKKWQLFAKWWNKVSDFAPDGPVAPSEHLAEANLSLKQLFTRLQVLQPDLAPNPNAPLPPPASLDHLQSQINSLSSKLPDLAKGASDRFFQPRDPTLLLANIGRGWPADFTETLNVRIQGQTTEPTTPASSVPGWKNVQALNQTLIQKLGADLGGVAGRLLDEFYALSIPYTPPTSYPPPKSTATHVTSPQPLLPPGQVIPQFHDGRDSWQLTQPWIPLFVEWEAVYYHLPFELFQLQEMPRYSNWGANVIEYGVNQNLTVTPLINQANASQVSGRNILLPQAAANLARLVDNVLQSTNPDDLTDPKQYNLSVAKQQELIKGMASLEVISFPMTGFTSNLLTQREGSHVKPLVRQENAVPAPIRQAAIAGQDLATSISVDPNTFIRAMDVQTMLTPYGSSISVNFDADKSPLHPCTHGQLMFTKLNIIDKFGQAIPLIDPTPQGWKQPLKTMYPCPSDTFFPGTVSGVDASLSTAIANVVVPQENPQACPLIQVGPYINQPARLNAAFVVPKTTATGPLTSWTRCSEWMNPVWGWIVINYADSGLQLFLPDGTFYREVRFGGRQLASEGFKWLPFDPPTTLDSTLTADTVQLQFLAQKLATNPTYLQNFWSMIAQSLDDNQIHAPKTYATTSSAIVGKPLALVNAGWSLELADAPMRNWSTLNENDPVRNLLKPDGSQFAPGDPGGYTFNVKLGDYERSYDGLVGLFPKAQPGIAQSQTGSALNLDSIYTYFLSDTTPADTRKPIIGIPFTPYYIPADVSGTTLPDHDSHLQVFGLLLDPFQPVHAYSAILPNVSLKLPDWTVSQALAQMTAFWRVGPFLSPADVAPAYNPLRALTGANIAQPLPVKPPAVEPSVSLPLPPPISTSSANGARYRYLQPYAVGGTASTGAGAQTLYNPYGIAATAASGQDAMQLQLPAGPYTALEGYVQIVGQTLA